jgi:FAD/FMN-containing dehydrogenase
LSYKALCLSSIFCTTTRSGTCHLQQPIKRFSGGTGAPGWLSHLLTDPAKTQRYRKGFRSGQGEALAVVFPGTLLELWRVLNACVDADKIILMQAANTGLTEGSTPTATITIARS